MDASGSAQRIYDLIIKKRQEFNLEVQGEVTNFREVKCAVVSESEAARLVLYRSGESPFLMAEQL